MCGIFGAIGHNINAGTIRALALVNRERGTDSLGFFSSSGKFVKRAGDPLGCLGDIDFADFIDKSCHKAWFVAGHTRQATYGRVSSKNAHPFRYGRIIGAHNGCVTFPKDRNYRVDSEYLFDSLSAAGGDYQRALADISGYWGLTWFDGESFYLQSHNNEIALGRDNRGVWYYSSDWTHLEACVRITDHFTLLNNGGTIRFNIKCGKFERLPDFRSNVGATIGFLLEDSRGDRKGRKRRKHKKGTQAARMEELNTDPFYYDEDEKWAGVDHWSEYIREYN